MPEDQQQPLLIGTGSPSPLGARLTWDETTYNFALYSVASTSATLLFYRADDVVTAAYQVPLDPERNRSGMVWHCRLPRAFVEQCKYYAYSITGDNGPGTGGAFDPEKILVDPYARAIAFPPDFSREAASRPGSNAGRAPLGLIPVPRPAFDWSGDAFHRHASGAVIYEMHVKGFTNNPNSGVKEGLRGTYLGAIEKIPYLVDLGVTVVELMPIYLYDPEPGGDYWGYMPMSFFAPHRGYAYSADPAATIDEVKTLVKAFHAAGIEVVLDVVYNHTTEMGSDGPTYSFRGIDNQAYYLLDPEGRYLDFTGCGNSVDTSAPAVRRLVADSLRYWVQECHIDGFRFDLAGIFSRKADGSIDYSQPAVVEEITSDPAFANIRLIAEPYDADGYNFELGLKFPGVTWAQWNTLYRDDVRRLVIGAENSVPSLMTRIYGSAMDLFPDRLPTVYHPRQSINFVDCHDGFTLYDLVSYNEPHNEANGAGYERGSTFNLSDNCGFEGAVGAPQDVVALRKKRVKGFFAILMVSNGTPMFVMGDEFLRTQFGNNNPYNQDNEMSWLDWSLLDENADIHRFFKLMIAFRKAHPTIAREVFWREDVSWYGPTGAPDLSPESGTLAFCLRDPQGYGSPGGRGCGTPGPALYVMINFSKRDVAFTIQEGAPGSWMRAVDTGLESPDDIAEPGGESPTPGVSYAVKSQSVVALVSR
jgi:glycogen operon protein